MSQAVQEAVKKMNWLRGKNLHGITVVNTGKQFTVEINGEEKPITFCSTFFPSCNGVIVEVYTNSETYYEVHVSRPQRHTSVKVFRKTLRAEHKHLDGNVPIPTAKILDYGIVGTSSLNDNVQHTLIKHMDI